MSKALEEIAGTNRIRKGEVLPPGCPTVLIGGMPAARMGDLSGCGAPIVMGAPTVIIGG